MTQVYREILWNVPKWIQIAMYILLIFTLLALSYKFYQKIHRLRKGKKENYKLGFLELFKYVFFRYGF
jgi:uncharacterized membrane protein YqhA